MSALFAVTTCLPEPSALVTTVLARSVPPITSTTSSTASSSSTSFTSVTIAQPSGSVKSFGLGFGLGLGLGLGLG